MNNYEAIREVLNRISGQQNVFTVPKIYVDFTGDLTTAVLLNQIVFLSDKSKRKDGYFYKTYKEWEEEICLSERQVRHSVKKLKEMELVETTLKKANGSPTVHYKLHFDKLVESILTFCQIPNQQSVSIQNDNMSETLTENTTETTTENKESSKIQHLDYVYLKESEYERLIEDYGKKIVDSKIDDLDTYLSNKGKNKFKDHNKTLRNWLKKDGAKKKVKKTKQDEQHDRIRQLKDIIGLPRDYYVMENEAHVYDEAKKELERLEQL